MIKHASKTAAKQTPEHLRSGGTGSSLNRRGAGASAVPSKLSPSIPHTYPLSVSWNTSCNSQDFVSKALTATPQSIINQMKFLSVFFIIALIGAAAGQTYIPMADVIAQRCNFSVACIQQSPVPIEGQVFSSYFNLNLTEWTHYSTEDALGAMLKCPMGFYPDPVYSYYCVQYTKKVAKSICLARNTLQCTDVTGNIALSPIGCCPKPS